MSGSRIPLIALITTGLLAVPVHSGEHTHLGVSAGIVHIPDEESYAGGVHLHLIRELREGLGVGAGLEAVQGKHTHLGVFVSLWLTLSGGLKLGSGLGLSSGEHRLSPAYHLELLYELEVSGIRTGPFVGIGGEEGGTHYTAGVHVGF